MEVGKCSKRLEAIISFVKEGSYPADIGSDHAYVPLALVSRGIVTKAFAVDNKIGPYKIMKERINKEGYEKQIGVSLSSGLSDIPSWVNALIIAGMGGLLIRDILEEDKDKLGNIDYLVIDAHSEYPVLLKWLMDHSFYAKDDIFLYDKGKPYCVYLFEKNKEPISYSEEELFFGPIEIKRRSEEWERYWKAALERDKNILAYPSIGEAKQKELQKEIEAIEKAFSYQSEDK